MTTKIILSIIIIISATSCKTQRHIVTHNTTITDTYQSKQNYTDSVKIYDSISVMYQDSIKIVYHYVDRYKVNTKTDSVIINDTVTICQELSTDIAQNDKNNNKKSSSNKIIVICIFMLIICIIIYKNKKDQSSLTPSSHQKQV